MAGRSRETFNLSKSETGISREIKRIEKALGEVMDVEGVWKEIIKKIEKEENKKNKR